MALKLGELSAIIKADAEPFRKGLEDAKTKFAKFGDKLKTAGIAIGAAVGVVIASGIASAIDFNQAKTKLAAQLGGDTEFAARMGRIAGDVYSKGFGESLGQVSDALRAVLSSGLVTDDASDEVLEGITTKVQALATAFDEDVSQAARAAGQLIRTGLVKDANQALDLLTVGFQQTGDLADDLLDTFSEYSTKFRDLGLSGPQALGLLRQGLRAGARDTDFIADALKEFAIRAIDGSELTAQGFRMLGLNAREMAAAIAAGGPQAAAALDLTLDRLRSIEDPVQRDAAAVALFGTKAEDLGDALYALDVSEAENQLGRVEGAAQTMSDTLEQSASQRLESFKRKAQEALVEKLNEALPTLEKVGGWMKDHEGLVTAVVGALGAFALIIGTIIGVYKVWIAVQTALNIVMSLNPIGLIVLAIGALIAVFVLLWNKSEAFRNFWKKVWEGIQSAAKAVGDWFVNTLWHGILEKAFKWIGNAIGNVLNWFKEMPGKIGSFFSNLKDKITAPFRAAFNFVSDIWNNTIGKLSWTVPSWVPVIGGNTISAPKLPKFHMGGVVPGPPGAEVLAILQAGERVIPAGASTTFTGNITVNISVKDLAQLRTLEEFLDMLRSNTRRGLATAA